MRRATGLLATVLLIPALAAAATPKPISSDAVGFRDVGLAQLENEHPEKAEKSFRALIHEVPDEPLGYADLAISLLRQQRSEEALVEIDRALEKAPGRGDLLAIRGDILQWSGRADDALAAYRAAAEAAPDDPEVLYGLYRQASTMEGETANQAAGWAVERLAKLRPENVVVLSARGQRAIADGDRRDATAAFLRIRELLWQAPPVATTAMEMVLSALKSGDLSSARVPALRLENVLKITAMYRESLRELLTGIQGIPVQEFVGVAARGDFGAPGEAYFELTEAPAGEGASAGSVTGLVACDLDGDQKPDLAFLRSGETPTLEIRRAAGEPAQRPAPRGLDKLLCFDLDNDGHQDLLAIGPKAATRWRGDGAGGLTEATAGSGLEEQGAAGAVALDFDIDGDLDIALVGGTAGAGQLLYNDLEGPLRAVGAEALPTREASAPRGAHDVFATDLDRDGDLDLVVASDGGVTFWSNLRQGRFEDRTSAVGLGTAAAASSVISADLDGDGLPELITAGSGVTVYRNLGDRFEPLGWEGLPQGSFDVVVALDADNDGRLDLAAGGPSGLVVAQQRAGRFTAVEVRGAASLGAVGAIAATDLDGDGDLDLVTAGEGGVRRFVNRGGEKRNWLAVRLRGLDQGSSKNNVFGLGAVVEVRSGGAYQLREADGDVVHFGLGDSRRAYLVRVVWTNGVPQNRLMVHRDQLIVEEQLLKGSCPFLYAWDGERMRFVTDLLWGAPIGMPLAPGVWAGADPSELVRVDGLVEDDGVYRLSVTEELWEAAYFDALRLWVVDHPAEVEVASSLRIQPGQQVPDRVLASRDLRPVVAAWDGHGDDVTDVVARRDDVYADGYDPSRYQGVAERPWSLTFDLGEAPETPVRLHLDGWIFPADASLNLALAQRTGPQPFPPRLEVEVDGGWRVLMAQMGFPAGKTKTMVIDTPPLPAGAHRLRIVTGQWLHWDRVAWTTHPDDEAARVVARLPSRSAELRFRGFTTPKRQAPNAPHEYDYYDTTSESPWLPMTGRFTRYGEVGELLGAADDRSVILAPGDEIALEFDASALPPLAAGWVRTVFLESHGWDKDADRNTYAGDRAEPLPFRAMSGYPYGPGESFPDTEEMRRYREEWLTREIEPEAGRP
ncbi:MAG: VCBS repeat-containing protein [Acidobacteria bacterium]|nr:VCBS repeat-containing protein [Acidobacteriota bacterium]